MTDNRENIRLELVKLCHKPTMDAEAGISVAKLYEAYIFEGCGVSGGHTGKPRGRPPKRVAADEFSPSVDTEESLSG